MNSTRWPSLTEFAKHLGREGICRVEDVEGKGLHVSWIDNSPEALRRQDAIRKKERMDRGDEEREQRLIREQIERAEAEKANDIEGEGEKELRRQEGEKIKLSFGKPKTKTGSEDDKLPAEEKPDPKTEEPPSKDDKATSRSPAPADSKTAPSTPNLQPGPSKSASPPNTPNITQPPPPEKVTLKLGTSSKPKNVFATSKKNAFSSSKPSSKTIPSKPMSEAERIMKEEIERKRARETNGFAGGLNSKRQRIS